MAYFEVKNKKDNSTIIGNIMDEVENVNVREYFFKNHLHSQMLVLESFLDTRLGRFLSQVFYKYVERQTEEHLNKVESTALPPKILQLFDEDLKKKEQISLLKGVTLTPNQLGALFLQAGKRGYKFSNYRFEGKVKNYTEKELPTFAYLHNDGSVRSAGETSLTDGQIKDLILTSTFLLSRIFDNGKHWHCFFQSSKGLQGKEPGKLGSLPHIHYISDSFGISKEDLIKAIKSGNYPTTPVHIMLAD